MKDKKAVHRKEPPSTKERKKVRALKEKGLKSEVLEKKEKSVAAVANNVTLRDDSSSTSSGLGFIMKGSSFSDTPPVLVSTPKPTSSDLGFIMKGSSFLDVPVMASTPESDGQTDKTSLFDSIPEHPAPSAVSSSAPKTSSNQKHFVTPTTSYPPLPIPEDSGIELPTVPKSFPLFRYLHSLKYYHMPGLRFGCHYNAYPGDPLRYHSHFAATGMGWDDEFTLLDIVGGGRLATGTKKAYMIGGEDVSAATGNGKARESAALSSDVTEKAEQGDVRAFSIEWAAI